MITRNALMLAPMAEINHCAFRLLVDSFGGCDYFASEMISAKAYCANGPLSSYYTNTTPHPKRTMLQLVSGSAEHLVRAASKLEAESDCLGIDINFGCTAHDVTKLGGGIRWMREHGATKLLLTNLRRVIQTKLFSIKIRIGYDESYDTLRDFARMAEDAGIDYLIFHGRTKKDKMAKVARWEYLDRLAADVRIPIVGNGDIVSFETYLRKKQHAAHAYMIARKAIRAPWIFDYLRKKEADPSIDYAVNLVDMLTRFFTLIETHVPQQLQRPRLKKFASYFTKNLLFGNALYGTIEHAKEYSAMKDILFAYFLRNPNEVVWHETE